MEFSGGRGTRDQYEALTVGEDVEVLDIRETDFE